MSEREYSEPWIIVPYDRVGPLWFGMTPDQVTGAIDGPDAWLVHRAGVMMHRDSQVQVHCTGVPARVREIEIFSGPRPIRLGDVELMNDAHALDKLVAMDGDALYNEEDESYLFLKLGICTNDFRSADQESEPRMLCAFDHVGYNLLAYKPLSG